MKRLVALIPLLWGPCVVHAQTASATVVSACGTPPATYVSGYPYPVTQNTLGQVCGTVAPASAGGLSVKSFIVAANTTSVAVDASAGQIYAIAAYGVSAATPVYLKFYNTAQGSTTCGSGTPVERHIVSTSAIGGGIVVPINSGVTYSTAITVCVTAGIADNDTTSPAASSYIVNVYYK